MRIKNVSIIGLGAVGGAIAYHFLQKTEYNFSVIACDRRAEKIRDDGIIINEMKYKPDVNILDPIDLLIITVKNYNLDQAIMDIRHFISYDTIILPLLNGVTAPDILRTAFPENIVMNGIILRTDASRINNKITFTTTGEIQLGHEKWGEYSEQIRSVVKCLNSVGLNAKHYQDIKRMQWRKWMINIGCNQVSVEADAEFYYFGKIPEIVELMDALMNEILLIAEAENVNLTEKDKHEVIDIIINYPPHKKTSMLQDLEARRKTEIDYFAGTVIEYGKKHKISTPINYTLYLAIKAKEKVYLMKEKSS